MNNKSKYLGLITTTFVLTACTANKELNCHMYLISKNCHYNTDRLERQNSTMADKCIWAKYHLRVAESDNNKADIKNFKKKVTKNCIASE